MLDSHKERFPTSHRHHYTEKIKARLVKTPFGKETAINSLNKHISPTLADGGANLLPLCLVQLPCISVRITDPPSSM